MGFEPTTSLLQSMRSTAVVQLLSVEGSIDAIGPIVEAASKTRMRSVTSIKWIFSLS